MSDDPRHWRSLLGVGPDAGVAEIKKAYRRKAKKLHPDLNPAADSRQMHDLVRAYEGLVRLREEMDALGINPGFRFTDNFNYRDFLRKDGSDRARALLILHDLLHGEEEEAISLFLASQDRWKDMLGHLGRQDFMDCGFLVAEELLARGVTRRALDILYEISRAETQKPYFHFFFDDIKDLTRQGIQSLLASSEAPGDLGIPERFMHVQSGRKDQAWFFRIMSEWCVRRNRMDQAVLYLSECLRLDPAMKGLKDLKGRLRRHMENSQ